MKFLFSTLLLTFSLLLFSCEKEKELKISVPNKILPYVNNFFTESINRGLFLEKDVTFVLTDNRDSRLIGDAGKSDLPNKLILIDTTSNNYQYYAEALIFHEMGHYFLLRKHRDGNFNNKNHDPISIMHPYAYVNFTGSFLYKRQYYINELFNENTPTPYWGN